MSKGKKRGKGQGFKDPKPRRPIAHWPRFRRHAVWLILLLAVVALALFGRTSYSLWARQTAAKQLQIGAIGTARQQLLRAARTAPNDGAIDMMLAFCFRQFHQVDRWRETLESAAQKGIAPAQIEREVQLYRIQTGNWYEGTESQLAAFAAEGVTAYDVPAVFVSGRLANGETDLAKQILDVWSAHAPNDAHVAHMMGKYWETLGDTQQAQAHYETAIALEPRHALARISLATLFEQDDQLNQAFRQYAALGAVSPSSEVAALGAARIQRKMAHLDRAQAILEPFVQASEPPAEVAVEMGRIAMDRGDFPTAERWFQRAGVEQTRDPRFQMSMFRLLGMRGKTMEADRFFARIATVGRRVTRMYDLRVRLALDPTDTAATAEIKQLSLPLDVETPPLETMPSDSATENERSSPGYRLFVLHCSACHGPLGDGNGRAARHLFPFPRDLRREPSRLVSTDNGVPTLDDTVTVLRRGISGTSMPSYDDVLNDEELRLLAGEVHRLRRDGLRERLVNLMELDGDDIDEEDENEVRETVDHLASPGKPIVVPRIGPAEPPSIVRGKETYQRLGCASCHGADGAGVAEQIWCDERGFPVRTRDLAREFLKGGQDAASIYLRIAAGMPGTPHPSSSGLPQQQLIDLVQFCLSLSREPKRVLTDHQRATLATSRAYLASRE
ncbi:MAG: c-type cytochrome [Pirellulaceae bacterium]